MKILVTGANGMLGQDLCPILEDNGFEVLETDIDTLDITNVFNIKSVIKNENPDIVIHCAAYTNVDEAEKDLEKARLINYNGTENIAKICAEKEITLVYISTDYVFEGLKNKPYTPIDSTNPINNYGLTKKEGEDAIKRLCKNFFIIRTSWLYGHHGKNFVETMINLANKNKEIKVVDDQIGCPTWTVDLANGIVEIIEDYDYGVYHVCGSGETSWFGFAKEIFKQINMNVNLLPCLTNDFPRPAKRPKYSVMENNGICRDWRVALKEYLILRPEGE